jgi:hypothetical protein
MVGRTRGQATGVRDGGGAGVGWGGVGWGGRLGLPSEAWDRGVHFGDGIKVLMLVFWDDASRRL